MFLEYAVYWLLSNISTQKLENANIIYEIEEI